MRDGAWVTLTGNIHRQLGKDHYEFHDKTGSLALHIAPDGWHGADISPDDLIIISGRLHKGPRGTSVEVEQLQKNNRVTRRRGGRTTGVAPPQYS